MPQSLNLDTLIQWFSSITNQINELIKDPTFWPQFITILVIFALSRWLISPLIHHFLDIMMRHTNKVVSFRRLWSAIRDNSTPISWLVLQWISIGVFRYIEIHSGALVTVASLLTAWIMIQLASLLVINPSVARFISISAWTIAALNIFGLLNPTMALLDSWAVSVGNIRLSPLTAIKIGLSLWFALWLANAMSSLLERRLEKSENTNASTRVLISKLTRITLVLLAILIALSSVGIDLTALAIFSGALGVGLGFGLQKIFSNLVSGVILLMDKSIKPGDVISLGMTFGWINYLGLRYVSVITRDGIEHLIPNEEMITQRVENWSYSNKLVRLKAPIGISYNSDVRLAMKLCIEAIQMVPRIKTDPEPKVQLMGFGDNSVNLELRFWIDDPELGRANIITEIFLIIWDKFRDNDISIPFPQRDLHIASIMGEKDLSNLSLTPDHDKPIG